MSIGSFLFEIGAEELPAGQILAISNHIKTKLEEVFEENLGRVPVSTVYTSPRRLFWEFKDIELEAKSQTHLLKGPAANIAKDSFGNWTPAALGFAKKNKINIPDLYVEDGYLLAKQTIQARKIQDLLEEQIPQIIASTPGTRFMRWANSSTKFARPIQWIAAFIVSNKQVQILDFQIENIKAGKLSQGHRFLDPSAFEFASAEEYRNELKKRSVIIDPEERKQHIIKESEELAKSINGQIIVEPKLLDELISIAENPSPILCQFDSKFLAVPDCVLQMVMLHHQRYIPIVSNGKLMPYFIAVSNNPLPQAIANIKSGNEKVIIPRFKDAEFFVQEDSRISLAERVLRLEKMNFLKGTFLQKTKRLEKIVARLIKELEPNYQGNPAAHAGDDLSRDSEIIKATTLSKADLTTNLVFEFTELQGQIGAVYAKQEGLSDLITSVIEDQYKPRFASDELPRTIGSKLLALADKLDNLVCAFALGNAPTGSADPFALRRQANGLLEIALHSHLIINLDALVDFVIKLQISDFGEGQIVTKIKGRGDKRQEVQVPELNWQDCPGLVKDFLSQRLLFVFETFHKNFEINKAVLAPANPLLEPNKHHMLVHSLNSLKNSASWTDFILATKRVFSFGQRSQIQLDSALFVTEEEVALYAAFGVVAKLKSQNLNYEPLLLDEDLLSLIKPINNFFDKVLINVEDSKLKNNRIALVTYAADSLMQIADFSTL